MEFLVSEMVTHQGLQLELCHRLECLADALPKDFDRQECLSIATQIYPTIKSAHKFEEELLFPALLSSQPSMPNATQSIERLKFEHWEDESTAEDLSLALSQLVRNPGRANPDKIAYMLRCLFDGLKRHIAYEHDHILPHLRNMSLSRH